MFGEGFLLPGGHVGCQAAMMDWPPATRGHSGQWRGKDWGHRVERDRVMGGEKNGRVKTTLGKARFQHNIE